MQLWCWLTIHGNLSSSCFLFVQELVFPERAAHNSKWQSWIQATSILEAMDVLRVPVCFQNSSLISSAMHEPHVYCLLIGKWCGLRYTSLVCCFFISTVCSLRLEDPCSMFCVWMLIESCVLLPSTGMSTCMCSLSPLTSPYRISMSRFCCCLLFLFALWYMNTLSPMQFTSLHCLPK